MIEWAFPLMLVAAAAVPKKSKDDKKKIQEVFKNVGYGQMKDGKLKTPKFLKKVPIYDGEEKEENRIGTTYNFALMPGLPATKMQQFEEKLRVFSDYLRKPVLIRYDIKRGFLVNVYDENIPGLIAYHTLPKTLQEFDKNGKPLPLQWIVPIGRAIDGLIWHNFDHVPHMTVAGTTRFGKTVFLRMLMTYLTENHPDDVEFYIIDLKGGLEFGRYENLRQVVKVASRPEEAAQLLEELEDIYEQDYAHFRKNYLSNIADTKIKKRRFVIVDEAAQLAAEKWQDPKTQKTLNYCQAQLSKIAYLTGALGYRMIFATQYPVSSTLPRMIKQNADAKISFRLPSGYASEVAIDEYGAEKLPSDVKGRALFKTHELKEMQAPFISHEEMWERLQQYQQPVRMKGEPDNVIEFREEEATPGEDFVQFDSATIRNA